MLDKLRANLKLFSILVFAGCIVLLAVNALTTPRFPMPTVEYHAVSQAQSDSAGTSGSGEPESALSEDFQPSAQAGFAFPININEASAAALEELPGIGPVMAQRIFEYRSASGGFSSLDELLNVKGIGEKTLEKMRPLICLE